MCSKPKIPDPVPAPPPPAPIAPIQAPGGMASPEGSRKRSGGLSALRINAERSGSI
jgi:hypothetical protein